MTIRMTATLTALLLLISVSMLWADDPLPTNNWTDFGSNNTTINGVPAPLGAVIEAFDGELNIAGRQYVGPVPGRYVAMPVYGDDPDSDPDEGCFFGEHVIFMVNGKLATELGPDNDVWRDKGSIKIMDLAITQAFGLDLTGPPSEFGEPGQTVQHDITLENTGDGIDLVDIEVTTALGWQIISQPTSPAYFVPGSHVLTVQVVIPAGTPADTEDTLTLTATSKFEPGTSDIFKATTTAGQYYGLGLGGPPSGSGGAGDTVEFDVDIENLGNGEDSVLIEITSSNGWPLIDPPTPTQGIAPFDTLDLLIKVEIPEDAPEGAKDTVTVIVTSQGDPTAVDTLKLVITVGPAHAFSVTGPSGTVGDPGDAILYTPVTIQNVGDETDHAIIDWNSSLGWDIDGPTSPTGEIISGGTMDLDFTVNIPGDAVIGSEDVLTIVVASQTDPAIEDTLLITTLVGREFGVEVTGPSGSTTPIGGSVIYPVVIENTGNVEDDFANEVTSSMGWSFSGEPQALETIGAGGSKTFNIKLDIPGDANLDDVDTLTIISTSQETRGLADTLKIITSVNVNYGVRVTGPLAGLGVPEEEVHYSVTVENTGNIEDIYDLTAVSSKGWLVSGVPAETMPIQPQAGKVLDVVVTIPVGALPAEVDTLVIVAASRNDAETADTLKIVTTVDDHTAVEDDDYILPGKFALAQNYPNPFNMETLIRFSLARSAEIELSIYDVLGRKMRTLVAGYLPAGEHILGWDGIDQHGSEVASGVYFYRLTGGAAALTRKMVLLK